MNKRVEEMINYEMGIDEAYCLENALKRICEIDESKSKRNRL